jgi:hypothetical protein
MERGRLTQLRFYILDVEILAPLDTRGNKVLGKLFVGITRQDTRGCLLSFVCDEIDTLVKLAFLYNLSYSDQNSRLRCKSYGTAKFGKC